MPAMEGHAGDSGEMSEEDLAIKNLIGQPYWENRHNLKYGGAVNTKGIIVKAYTKDEGHRCNRSPFNKGEKW